MGYDIHITRQENWFDQNNTKKISLDEWTAYVGNDPEMRLDNFAEATTSSEEIIQIENNGLAVWTGYSGNGLNNNFACFNYNNGNIICKNPDDEILSKMLNIAQQLGAKVQGDEGELYEQSTNKLSDRDQQKPWWKFW